MECATKITLCAARGDKEGVGVTWKPGDEDTAASARPVIPPLAGAPSERRWWSLVVSEGDEHS